MREELDDLQVAALSLLLITASCYVGTLKSFLVICAPFIPFIYQFPHSDPTIPIEYNIFFFLERQRRDVCHFIKERVLNE